jgi:CHAT domain-containing protein/Tfp pilus assembly protein PilF
LSFVSGCNLGPEPQPLYLDARQKLTQGFFDAALQEADQGYRISERSDNLWSWKFRILKAEVYLRQGSPQKSVELLAEDPPPNSPLEVSASRPILQGEALCRLNRPREAEAAIHDVEQRIPSTRRDLQAELAFTRGRCSLPGNRTAAMQFYRTAADLAHGEDRFVEASSLINLGLLLLQDQHYVQAMQELSKALSTTDSPFLKEKALGNLAECHAELGDWRQSIFLAEEAEKLAAQIKNDGDRKTWLIDLGRAHLALREFSKAEPYFTQALAIAEVRRDTDAIWRCLNNLTQLALKRHDLSTAEKYWKEESALNLGAEGRAYVTFDAAKIAMERKELLKAEQLLKDVLGAKTNDSLRLITQRELGNVYWQESKSGEADRTFREAINDAETVVSKLPPEHRMSFLDVDTFYDSYVRFLVAQGKPLEALKVAERGRAQILAQALRDAQGRRSAFDLLSIQSVLKKHNQIALAYSLTDDESFLWVITPRQFKLFRLPSHRLLRPQIDAYKQEVVDHPRALEDSSGLQELYKTLVQPAENLIPKGSRVVVISSKILSLVNFEALIVPGDDPHYWIEDVQIQSAGSLALLAHSKPGSGKLGARKKELFLLGAPIAADNSLPALKHAAEEMDRVRSHFPVGEETIISGKDAIPQAYRASKPGQYRLIHIDAHSLPSDLSPLDSFIVLSPAGENSYKLHAHEIEDTPLQADLVTLSACYSAGTRWYQGEGIVGLGWAFLRAGAHQVVASLWAVDEASTPQLMDDFYRELSQGKPAAEALRDAKLKMLHAGGQGSRPYYWASLQLYTGS